MSRLSILINKVLGKFNIRLVRAASYISPLTSENQDGTAAGLIRHQTYCKWSTIDAIQRITTTNQLNISCPLCSFSTETKNLPRFQTHCIFNGGILDRWQCPSCDLIFGPNKMLELSTEELSQDYEWHYRVYSEGDSTEQELRAFYALNPDKNGVYLNYGAGSWSNSIQQLRQEGWNVFAFEPHASAARKADHVISDHVTLSSMRFDGIFSNNVLEHLRHPVEELRLMASLLKQNGQILHATPCFKYLYEYTRFHLFFYPGKSKELLAHKAKLEFCEFYEDGEFMFIRLKQEAL